jgi:hypothetical protein
MLPFIFDETIVPYSIDVDQQHHLVIAKFWGVFGSNELEDELAEMDRMGPFDNRYRLLNVFAELMQYAASTDALRNTARERTGLKWPEKRPFHPRTKRVIVAPTDTIFGLARLYDAEAYNDELTVVRTITEAAAELGMDVADIDMTFPV